MNLSGAAALVVAIVILAGSAGAAPSASIPASVSPSGPTVGWINISAVNQYGYSPPDLQQVPTNALVHVTFTDETPMEHTFTIIGKQGWVVPSSYNQAQIDQLAFGNNPRVLVNANVSGPGDVNNTQSFTSPGPGWYEFICTVSGHFALGMFGFVAFGMDLPSNLTQSNRTTIGGGLSFNTTEAIVVGALVVIALGAYVAVRRLQSRARQEQEELENRPRP